MRNVLALLYGMKVAILGAEECERDTLETP